ncbi:hypothetical protein Barb7_02018 [Bacteroidales bacterium Barb7]|nr:hypothetical protein Barb7_02018 [Bacteroidales bacterium Barb7]
MSGSSFAESDVFPRMDSLASPPASPVCVRFTPAEAPDRACARLTFGIAALSSIVTRATAPVRSLFFNVP